MLIKTKFCKFIAWQAFLVLVVATMGCKTLFVKNPERKAQKAEKKEFKETQKAKHAAVKSHFKIQNKETRKRMTKSYKKTKKRYKAKKRKSSWDCN